MARRIFWLLLIVLMAAYAYIVISWWNEGTESFERQRIESCAEYRRDGTPYDLLPAGCREMYTDNQ